MITLSIEVNWYNRAKTLMKEEVSVQSSAYRSSTGYEIVFKNKATKLRGIDHPGKWVI